MHSWFGVSIGHARSSCPTWCPCVSGTRDASATGHEGLGSGATATAPLPAGHEEGEGNQAKKLQEDGTGPRTVGRGGTLSPGRKLAPREHGEKVMIWSHALCLLGRLGGV